MSKVKVEDLWVKVTYEVKLGDLEIPKDVYDEIEKASDEHRDIEMNYGRYPLAEDWLSSKINESDCMEWKCEVIDLVLDDTQETDG
jgi:hypothetical protein